MKARIEAALDALEHEEGVRVLYACESGSQAWGMRAPPGSILSYQRMTRQRRGTDGDSKHARANRPRA